MRFYIVGHIPLNQRHAQAYKIYDADSKKTGLFSKENVFDAVQRGILVVGIERKKAEDGWKIRESTHTFGTKYVDKLNCKGEPLRVTGTRILLNIKGFGEDAKYRTVNSKGIETWINHEEFIRELEYGNIVGAMKTSHGFRINENCNKQYYGEILE